MPKKKLKTDDEWYVNNLMAIIDAQIKLVEKGKQQSVNRRKIRQFVLANQ